MRWLLIMLLCTYHVSAQDLKWQVLDANEAFNDGQSIDRFDEISVGQKIEVQKEGNLYLVSNYFHGIAIEGDTIFVLPDILTENLDGFKSDLGLEYFFGDKPQRVTGAVMAGMPEIEPVYPPLGKWAIGKGGDPCMIWQENRNYVQSPIYKVQVMNIFYEELKAYETQETMWSAPYDSLSPLFEYSEGAGLLLQIADRVWMLEDTRNVRYPFDPCSEMDAFEQLRFAMYLETKTSTPIQFIDQLYNKAIALDGSKMLAEVYQTYIKRVRAD